MGVHHLQSVHSSHSTLYSWRYPIDSLFHYKHGFAVDMVERPFSCSFHLYALLLLILWNLLQRFSLCSLSSENIHRNPLILIDTPEYFIILRKFTQNYGKRVQVQKCNSKFLNIYNFKKKCAGSYSLP